jgi:hypothetical protein
MKTSFEKKYFWALAVPRMKHLVSLIRMIMLIKCLRDPKSCWNSKSGFKFEVQFLHNVDPFAQSAIFENLLESN